MGNDWLRDKVETDLVVERDGWAGERIARVMQRLQRDTPAGECLETLVIWIDEHTAFTSTGRTVYVSRRLLERLPDDDAAAFVIAHELAHHRLGHVPRADGWLGVMPLRVALLLLHRTICGPEDEREADLLAAEMCLDAGYDLDRCLAALELFAQVTLDYGDVDGAIGGETAGAARWLGQRRRGYYSVAERIAAVRAHAVAVAAGTRLQGSTRPARDRTRQAKRVLAVGGAALAALAIFRRR